MVDLITPSTEENRILSPNEWPTSQIEDVDTEIVKAAREIRLYYYKQLPLLRQIPYLALEADGRGGWNDEYGRAYDQCMMAIHRQGEVLGSYPSGSYDMFIELRTGMLIGAQTSQSTTVITPFETIQIGGDSHWGLATDREVFLKLAYQDERRRFNPTNLIKWMTEGAKDPYHNEPEAVVKALKQKEQDKLNLDKMMSDLPIDQVITTLREQGFEI